jgi:hypothetical protein
MAPEHVVTDAERAPVRRREVEAGLFHAPDRQGFTKMPSLKNIQRAHREFRTAKPVILHLAIAHSADRRSPEIPYRLKFSSGGADFSIRSLIDLLIGWS